MIWGVMALGVYITFRLLDFADLTVDGSIATGAAVSVMLIRAGVSPIATLPIAFLAGALAGMVTGLLNTALGIPGILASILTQISLYSINLNIMGKANQPVSVDNYPLVVSLRYVTDGSVSRLLFFLGMIVFLLALIAVMYWYFGTEQGPVSYTHLDVYKRQIQSYAPVLTAWKEFEPYEVVATTYQAISGAGKTFKDWPEMVGNIIPYIGGEEEKSEKEPLRIWGKVEGDKIVPATSPVITCQCIRVPVLNGHTAAVFVKFRKKPTKEQLIEKLVTFSGEPQRLGLPSAPKQFIQYLEEDNRPQVALDVDFENGMGISVGRLREDTVYDYKFVGLSHNTLRGAAGGALLCAELLKAQGYITKK